MALSSSGQLRRGQAHVSAKRDGRALGAHQGRETACIRVANRGQADDEVARGAGYVTVRSDQVGWTSDPDYVRPDAGSPASCDMPS